MSVPQCLIRLPRARPPPRQLCLARRSEQRGCRRSMPPRIVSARSEADVSSTTEGRRKLHCRCLQYKDTEGRRRDGGISAAKPGSCHAAGFCRARPFEPRAVRLQATTEHRGDAIPHAPCSERFLFLSSVSLPSPPLSTGKVTALFCHASLLRSSALPCFPSPCLPSSDASLVHSRAFSVTSRIHYLNSRTRFQPVLHCSDLAPSFLLLPLSSPRPVLAYHHRFRTRNKKRGSKFHPHPLPLPPPPLSPPRADAAHMYVGSPLSASALATAAGQQPLPSPLLRHLQALYPVFCGADCDPAYGLGASGEAWGLALLPPPSLVEPRHLEGLARRALHAHAERRGSDGDAAEARSDDIFWNELAERVEKVRDLLPIESLVRLLTILTLRGASASVWPVQQIFQAVEPHAETSLKERDKESREKSRVGLTLSHEVLPCVRRLPPRLLLSCTREFLEDLKKLSPPATAALAATFAWSNCASSALLFGLMERWGWDLSAERAGNGTESREGAKGAEAAQQDGETAWTDGGEEEGGEPKPKAEGEEATAARKQCHMGEFTPADFALFVSSLGHLRSQQAAAHAKHRRQARHLTEISGKQIMAAYRERRRRGPADQAREAEDAGAGFHFEPLFFDACCRYMAARADAFSLFSFASASRTLAEGLPTPELVRVSRTSIGLLQDSVDAGGAEGLALQRHARARASLSSATGSAAQVLPPSRLSVEMLANAIGRFVESWDKGEKKSYDSLASRAADLLLASRLLLSAAQCELYVQSHDALGRVERREASDARQGSRSQTEDAGPHGGDRSLPDCRQTWAAKALLEHITHELEQLNQELAALPRLNAGLRGGEMGVQKDSATREDSTEMLSATATAWRGFVAISPEHVYVRNALFAAAGESAAALLKLSRARSLSQASAAGEGRADATPVLRGNTIEGLQLDTLGELKPAAENLVRAVSLVLREREATGVPTEHLAGLTELLALAGDDKKGTHASAKKPRWQLVGFGDKGEKAQQANFALALQALSTEIVRRYAALSVEQKRRIKFATQRIGWKDPYLDHCLRNFTSAVAREGHEKPASTA
ncbi:hypothetical protein BESB_055380 [Besnoitia besnoiti]|uniref:Uncharacterized protein n=1 Tax=Besnoitia besnoiti TaxID=94643 RepID=A0A2A9MJW2_BESBE|nr:hypothetical protein BESB_055380 [Besnoitia besnoiti]PFH35887.1 hypothetical protein BESB_055380 [Besnoitia besnoiti]